MIEIQKLMAKVFNGLETMEKLRVLKIIRSEISDFDLFLFFNGAEIFIEKSVLKFNIPCDYKKSQFQKIFEKKLKKKLTEYEVKFL